MTLNDEEKELLEKVNPELLKEIEERRKNAYEYNTHRRRIPENRKKESIIHKKYVEKNRDKINVQRRKRYNELRKQSS